MPGSFHRFVYMRPYPRSILMPHQIRDADAAFELAPMLTGAGMVQGDVILNYPPPSGFPPEPLQIPEMGPDDLLLLTTRPPLDDQEDDSRKQVPRSYTDMEKTLFRTLDAAFTYCSRKQVELRKVLTRGFLPDCDSWSDASFSTYVRPTAGLFFAACTGRKAHGSRKWIKPDGPKSTAAYLALTHPCWPNGARLLCVFGITAIETLAWCHLLRKGWWSRLGITLDRPRFLMVELTPGELPPRPDTLEFAERWQVRILLDTPYPEVAWKGDPESEASRPAGMEDSQRTPRSPGIFHSPE